MRRQCVDGGPRFSVVEEGEAGSVPGCLVVGGNEVWIAICSGQGARQHLPSSGPVPLRCSRLELWLGKASSSWFQEIRQLQPQRVGCLALNVGSRAPLSIDDWLLTAQ